MMEGRSLKREDAIAIADEALLAELGYKQEFQRAFTPLEVSTNDFQCDLR